MPDDRAQTGLVLDVDRFSTHDGPGIRMAVFMKGCPLRCAWCHSPESQSARPELLYQQARCRACMRCAEACPKGAVSPFRSAADSAPEGITIDRDRCASCFACAGVCRARALRVAGAPRAVSDIIEIARRDQSYYDASGGGVTISGGEPLLQPTFTLALLRALNALGIHTAIETCGMGDEGALLDIAAYTDLLYYDIKLMDDEKHREYTGASNTRILSNLRALAADATLLPRVCVRTPCIPGVNDDPEAIRAVAGFVKGLGIGRMELMPYNPAADAKYEWLSRPYPLGGGLEQDKERYQALKRIIIDHGLAE